MQVHEAMLHRVLSVPPDATLEDAAWVMKNLETGPLPVVDHERLVGVITDRDITLRAVAEGRDPRTTSVRDVMTPGAVSCCEGDDVRAAALLMKDTQLRQLPVVDDEGRLTGVVLLGDLLLQAGD